jgi:hypothetical protein
LAVALALIMKRGERRDEGRGAEEKESGEVSKKDSGALQW